MWGCTQEERGRPRGAPQKLAWQMCPLLQSGLCEARWESSPETWLWGASRGDERRAEGLRGAMGTSVQRTASAPPKRPPG